MTIPPDPVAPPPLDADPVIQVDWLEFAAFFNRRGIARLDRLDNAMAVQEEESLSNDADADAIIDDRRALIEDEVENRIKALGDVYPFSMSNDGEELRIKPPAERRGGVFYLICLVISHFTRSPILRFIPSNDEISKVRKRQFQALATYAVAGLVNGPSISMGWPRPDKESILDVLDRMKELGSSGTPRTELGLEASPYAKDGGMDVIAWSFGINDRPPPASMWFGQVASGHNWTGKSAQGEILAFLWSYYDERPQTNTNAVTIIPHRLSDDEHLRHSARHGHILDRLRTPKAAERGYTMAKIGGVHVDGIEHVSSISRWVYDYRRAGMAA